MHKKSKVEEVLNMVLNAHTRPFVNTKVQCDDKKVPRNN